MNINTIEVENCDNSLSYYKLTCIRIKTHIKMDIIQIVIFVVFSSIHRFSKLLLEFILRTLFFSKQLLAADSILFK